MPVNADPHTWEASGKDIARLTESDSFISIGAHLEPFVESGGWRRAIVDNDIPQLILTEHVDLVEIGHGDHVQDLQVGDPHIWLDPIRVVAVLPAIEEH
jgi:ABC-type Zn uptake system ZnuABC Zn-binding protein ZnuA